MALEDKEFLDYAIETNVSAEEENQAHGFAAR